MACETVPAMPTESPAKPSAVSAAPWTVLAVLPVVFGAAYQCRGWLSSDEAIGDLVRWMSLVLAATLAKLSASVDDVVWLLPFLTQNRRRNALFYLGCMQLVVLVSWAFSAGGQGLLGALVPQDSTWPLDKVLNLFSALLLSVYTVKLFREWCLDGDGDDAEGESEQAADSPASPGKQKYTLRRLFTVAILGSLDDFAVFVSFLLSGLFSGPQLMVGVLLGSSLVVITCLGAGSVSFVVRLAEKVPLWVIVGAFAGWTYISTFAIT